jgi:hypothetical protein
MGIKIERPESLFGRHSYFKEQALFNKFMNEREKAFVWIDWSVFPPHPALKHLPMEKLFSKESRIKRTESHLCKAKQALEEMGL